MRIRDLHPRGAGLPGRVLSAGALFAALLSLMAVDGGLQIQGGLTTGVRAFSQREGFALVLVGVLGLFVAATLLFWRGLALHAILCGVVAWTSAFGYFARAHPDRSPLLLLNGRLPIPGLAALVMVAAFWICLLAAVLWWRHLTRRAERS